MSTRSELFAQVQATLDRAEKAEKAGDTDAMQTLLVQVEREMKVAYAAPEDPDETLPYAPERLQEPVRLDFDAPPEDLRSAHRQLLANELADMALAGALQKAVAQRDHLARLAAAYYRHLTKTKQEDALEKYLKVARHAQAANAQVVKAAQALRRR